MKKLWILPCLLLVLLLLAWFFRWDYGASKTYSDGIAKWKIDRWTGQGWMEIYTAKGFSEIPVKPHSTDKPYYYKIFATNSWRVSVAIITIWLLYIIQIGSYLKKRKQMPSHTTKNDNEENNIIHVDESVPQIRPWVRYWARMIDYSICGFFIGLILGIISPSLLTMPAIPLGMLICFIWLFIEAFLLSTWGTTPGKWLLRIMISDSSGTRLSFNNAIKRSFFCWLTGLGTGFPLISLVTLIYSYRNLDGIGTTLWDTKSNSIVSHQKIGQPRAIVAALVIIGTYASNYTDRIK